MNLNINLDDISVSNLEVLEILERSLRLDHDHFYIENGVVYHRTFNNWDGFTGDKTDIPEEVYSAYVTIRKYLLKEDEKRSMKGEDWKCLNI